MAYMHSLTNRMGKLLAVGLAALVVFSASVGAASADPVTPEPETSVNNGAGVLPCAAGSVTIRLPETNPAAVTENGIKPTVDNSGYKFTLTRVAGINLGDPAEWESIGKLKAEDIKPEDLTDESYTELSSYEGQVTFRDLPVGLYLARVSPPSTPNTPEGEVADFLVSIPTLDVDGWKCDGTIFAKKVPPYVPQPPTPETPEKPEPPLPKTGVQIFAALGASLVLLGAGFVLVNLRGKTRTV